MCCALIQAAKQEPSDFNRKLGLEKTFSLCQAADELKRYMARLKEAKTKLASALLRSWMEELESARLGKRGGVSCCYY